MVEAYLHCLFMRLVPGSAGPEFGCSVCGHRLQRRMTQLWHSAKFLALSALNLLTLRIYSTLQCALGDLNRMYPMLVMASLTNKGCIKII